MEKSSGSTSMPPYFQRVRYYGLHAGITYEKIKDQLPDDLKRNGQTVRKIIEILRTLLAKDPYQCPACGGTELEETMINQDSDYLDLLISLKKRGPPDIGRMGGITN